MHHTFHIPVLGLAYSVDTPVKVARFGISSVVSVIQHELLEQMRKFHSSQYNLPYMEITAKEIDFRAKRVKAYLNMLQEIVGLQLNKLRAEAFEADTDITRYFKMLPDKSALKKMYNDMTAAVGEMKENLCEKLRQQITAGSIDVNIMTKVDNLNYAADGETLLAPEFSDALSALRGFAQSNLESSVVFSAGLNPRLYSYIDSFPDFFPDENGHLKKKIILKVSDYRSALIQGKFLAKKGVWISEFRIESGLNCGGHAFATDGYLLGPILQEFKDKREELNAELKQTVNAALAAKNQPLLPSAIHARVTVQGGIGTAEEDQFLRDFYGVDATGWGSPFLLVPEATNVDHDTLQGLATAQPDDYYLSHASPLGVPFNNFRKSSAQKLRIERMEKGRPGSPCYKKHLTFNKEFTATPICEASRQYQHLKLQQLAGEGLTPEAFKKRVEEITEKDCLCEGLSATALLKNNIPVPRNLTAVTICPGPNLAFFSGVFTLADMVGHIYGRKNLLNQVYRPHMFVNELKIYINYLQTEIQKSLPEPSEKQKKYFRSFYDNLQQGIDYYRSIITQAAKDTKDTYHTWVKDVDEAEASLLLIFAASAGDTSVLV